MYVLLLFENKREVLIILANYTCGVLVLFI